MSRLLSPVELLLPDGLAERAVVLGDDCPSALVPASGPPGMPADLVVLAPSAAQLRDPTWIEDAVQTTAAHLSPDGIAYVMPSGAKRVGRALEAAGIHGGEAFLHIPDVARTRHVVPLRTAAERYALSGQVAMSPWKRLAVVAALRAPGLAALVPAAAIHRRGTAGPLCRWLFELGPRRPPGSFLLSTSGDGLGAAVHRFAAGERKPDAVAKVSPRAGEELRALRTIAPAAAAAGARVPEVLADGTLGSVPVVLQSALPGRNAALLIRNGRVKAQAVQERLGAWLTRWASAAMSRRALGPDDFERFVFRPAAELAPLLPDDGSYNEYLNHLCARATAETCPLVPSHGDLTSANVVLERSELGIVDWESAGEGSLPLFDFFYAMADAVAAKTGYADRLGAFVSCFAPEGPDTRFVAGLRRRLAEALSAGEAAQELSFHACWLHHAANEARRAPAYAGPFVGILETIVREPQRFSLSDTAR